MIHITQKNISEIWVAYLKVILKTGVWVDDDREMVFESQPIFFEISDFYDKNNLIEKYGDKKTIEIYTKKMYSMEIIKELNSTYGDRIFNNLGTDQFKWAVNKLRLNSFAKSCFIPLVIPNDPGPRIPCLSAIQIAIRKDKLNVYCTFRSQNALNSYANFIGIRSLQTMFAKELNVDVGSAFIHVNFPHIYKSDIEKSTMVAQQI